MEGLSSSPSLRCQCRLKNYRQVFSCGWEITVEGGYTSMNLLINFMSILHAAYGPKESCSFLVLGPGMCVDNADRWSSVCKSPGSSSGIFRAAVCSGETYGGSPNCPIITGTGEQWLTSGGHQMSINQPLFQIKDGL